MTAIGRLFCYWSGSVNILSLTNTIQLRMDAKNGDLNQVTVFCYFRIINLVVVVLHIVCYDSNRNYYYYNS